MAWTYPILETMGGPDVTPFVSTWFTVTNGRIVSNRLVPTVNGTTMQLVSKDITTSPDTEVRYTLAAYPDLTSTISILCRLNATASEYYALTLSYPSAEGGSILRLSRSVSGATQNLLETTVTVLPGNEIGLRVLADTITAYVNDSWQAAGYLQVNDAGVPAAGYFAIIVNPSTTLVPALTNVGGGPLPQPVAPGGSEADRGEFRGQLRGQLVGSP